MSRTIKEDEYIAKRNEILASAQRLVYTKGYGKMTIQDILDDIHISSGAFYHYFDSKPAILEAVIDRMAAGAERPLQLIADDPHRSAIEKLRAYFDTVEQMRVTYQDNLIELMRVWYTDDNVIIRQKVDEAAIERRAPLLNMIAQQGIREGVFKLADPERAGEIILALIQRMGNTHAKLLLSLDKSIDEIGCIDGIIATYNAYMAAIERVLGAPEKTLSRLEDEPVRLWVSALRGKTPPMNNL
jgi:AcrR family transcriptional regulator